MKYSAYDRLKCSKIRKYDADLAVCASSIMIMDGSGVLFNRRVIVCTIPTVAFLCGARRSVSWSIISRRWHSTRTVFFFRAADWITLAIKILLPLPHGDTHIILLLPLDIEFLIFL